ncbi:MAG: FecR domain-containing protein [Opitutaceae bacterium]|nr:FecR domain-containing protein [Opitutaceae bacterium]
MNTPDTEGDRFSAEDSIEVLASLWLVERADGLNARQLRELELWLAADPRHAAAFDRMERARLLLDRLPFAAGQLPGLSDVGPETAASDLRSALRWRTFGGLAAAIAISAIAWWHWPVPPPAPAASSLRYVTASGGYERFALNDNSIVELNANTELRVTITPSQRQVTLLSGEAHFTVAHDATRPFVVTAGACSVRAVGTAFNVRYAPVEIEVVVTEGRVLVVPKDSPVGQMLEHQRAGPLVAAGERVIIPVGRSPLAQEVETMAPPAMRAALAWQERKLVFAETPLRDVILQFNRRNRTQLVLGDSTLGEKLVGGTFDSDNVDAFVRLLEASGDIVLERRAEDEVLVRRAD